MATEKEIGEEVNVGDFHLDANHQPFIRVADGGSNCANCLYLKSDAEGNKCIHEDFIKFTGSDKLPDDIQNFCSDFYEVAPEPMKNYTTKGLLDNLMTWLKQPVKL